jgi:hypothetical protein
MSGKQEQPNSVNLRPFFFMVSFWGKRYRERFVDRCLPSLLSPNNFPLLRAEDGHQLLIATTQDDWKAIENLPIINVARKYVTPVLVEIEPASTSESVPGSGAAIYKQDDAQKRLVETAYAARAYATLLWPDLIWADGLVTCLQRWAAAGHCLVLFASLRQTEESTLEELYALGYLPKDAKLSQTGQPLTLPPRVIADLSVRHLHPEVLVYEANHPEQPPWAGFQFWRISGDRGILLHSHYCVPLMMDYAVLDNHDTDCLNDDIFEEVYILRNFYGRGSTYIVQDSDEFSVLSPTPRDVAIFTPPAKPRPVSWFWQLTRIREAMASHVRSRRNGLKRDFFRAPLRWHGRDIDDVWLREERRAEAILERAVGDYYSGANKHGRDFFPARFTWNPLHLAADWRFAEATKPVFIWLRTYWAVLWKALTGNAESWERIGSSVRRRVRELRARVLGSG